VTLLADDAPGAVAERRWRAMGAAAHAVVVAASPSHAEALAGDAISAVEELEARWSRFRPGSELCRLNALAGSAVLVSRETFDVVDRAIDAWRATGGVYDPTVIDALVAAGYDRDYATLADPVVDRRRPHATGAAPVVPGCAGILLDPIVTAVTLPAGVALDLGGIGKGRAADLVAEDLVARGALGALVNLGGDLRCIGRAPSDAGWVVAIDPVFGADLGAIALQRGAVATSSQLTRTWDAGGTRRHHLIDPRTAMPAGSDLAAVTVIGAEASSAEVLAKVALIHGRECGRRLLADSGESALLVGLDGACSAVGAFDGFRARVAAGHV
jgi:thiamine biosynthesis lipoprotein